MADGGTAVLGDIGRARAAFALTDADGRLRPETIRRYDARDCILLSAILGRFQKESGLDSLPPRCALSVAGLPRGETVSITKSRWFVSQTGLAAVLHRPPLILNNFAANAWAVSAADPTLIEAVGGASPGSGPGTFLVIGMELGLGVAVLMRDADGSVRVLPTEAGHSELIDRSPEMAPLVEIIRRDNLQVSAETLLACGGLAAIANAVAERYGNQSEFGKAGEVIAAAADGDAGAREATILFAKALWRFAGNLTMIFGAWDGLFFTADIVRALRSTMAEPEVRQTFVIPGPFAELLRNVPAGLLVMDDSALHGAAEALRQSL